MGWNATGHLINWLDKNAKFDASVMYQRNSATNRAWHNLQPASMLQATKSFTLIDMALHVEIYKAFNYCGEIRGGLENSVEFTSGG